MNAEHAGGRRPSRAAAVFLLTVLLLLQAGLQHSFARRYPAKNIENLLYLPKGEGLKIMSLGFRSLMADVLWMKAIGYFGGHTFTDQQYPWLYHILDQVTDLDPPFRSPYIFGGVVLSVAADSAEESIALLRKGMDYHPDDWRLPFYIGFNYFYYLKDPVRASEYIQVAATLPARPQYMPFLAASLMTEAGRLETAIAFLETVAANTQEEYVRRQIAEKIALLRAGEIPDGLEKFLSSGTDGK